VLHYACKNGTFEQIRRLVEANPSLLAQKTSEGLTPIMSCTISGREDAAIFLIDLDVRARGVNALLSDATIDGQTLLEWAGQFDRRKVLKKVLNLASIQLGLLPSSLSRVIKPLVHRLEDLLGLEASPVAESQPSRLRSALERIQERRRRE
jgi:ankyrin repeat protein